MRNDIFSCLVTFVDSRPPKLWPSKVYDLLEALPRGDAVHQQEAFTRSHVLLSHRGVLLLPGRIEHIEQRYLVVDHALLAV